MDITKLKNKIVEAVPSIMELGWGCEIQRYKKEPKNKYVVINDMGYAANKEKCWINSVPFGSMSMPIELLKSELGDKTGDWIILGRPITLHDIRLTLIKNGSDWGDCFREVSAMWNEIDNLDEQSDDCKGLLIMILLE